MESFLDMVSFAAYISRVLEDIDLISFKVLTMIVNDELLYKKLYWVVTTYIKSIVEDFCTELLSVGDSNVKCRSRFVDGR